MWRYSIKIYACFKIKIHQFKKKKTKIKQEIIVFYFCVKTKNYEEEQKIAKWKATKKKGKETKNVRYGGDGIDFL